MKVITSQHKITLEHFDSEDIYYCNYISKYNSCTPKCYKMLCAKILSSTGIKCNIPIFGWAKVFNDRKLDLDTDSLKRMCEMVGMDRLLYVLEVPDKYVIETAFYNFVDARCFEEKIDTFDGITCLEDFDWEKTIFINNVDEVQAILPFIKKEWIVEIYQVESITDYIPQLKQIYKKEETLKRTLTFKR